MTLTGIRSSAVTAALSLFCLLSGCGNSEREAGTELSPKVAEQTEVSSTVPPEPQVPSPSLTLPPAQLDWIGQQIFRNECGGRLSCLVHWNDGEAFPSLGIGHFIWYPPEVDGRFIESFPLLVRFMTEQGVALPPVLKDLQPFDAPWPDRNHFLAAEESEEVRELRDFLADTRGLQAQFIAARAGSSLAPVVAAAPQDSQDRVTVALDGLLLTAGGTYAVIDYINFKGEGLSQEERYNGEGWGLLQVLLAMEDNVSVPALDRFRDAAAEVLTRRAENAANPIERERWLAGWLNRVATYREPGEVGG